MADPLIDVRPEIAPFLTRTTRRYPVARLEVVHRTQSSERPVTMVECWLPDNSPRDFEEIAREATLLMQQDADQFPRPQRYWLYARGPQNEGRERVGFTVEPSIKDEEGSDEQTEEPNARGIAEQLMRHNEALHRNTVEVFGMMMRDRREERRASAERIDALESREIAVIDKYRDLQLQDREHQLQLRKEEREAEFQAKMLGKVELLMPVLVNKAMGRGTDANAVILEKVALLRRSLEMNPARIPRVMGILTPEQLAAASDLFSGNVGPMTGELIRAFFVSLERPQLEAWADGVLTGDEMKLVSEIYNACAEITRKDQDRNRRMVDGHGREKQLAGPSPVVQKIVEAGAASVSTSNDSNGNENEKAVGA